MKRIYLILFLLLAIALPGMAQKREKNRDEMRKEILDFKLKFLAQEMELTPEQQQKFFPLYTQMENERFELYREASRAEKKVKEASATEEDYAAAAEMSSSAKLKEAQIEEKYNEKFKAFLSPKQMYKMKEAEEKFRKKMREMRKGSGKKK